MKAMNIPRPRLSRIRAGMLLATTALSLPLEGMADQIPERMFPAGVGVNIHFTRGHERDLDLIAAAGFKIVRMDFGWGGTERQKGEYDWSAYEELTANLEKRELKALYILDYSNSLYEEIVVTKNPISGREQRDVASPQHPESVAAFARWAGAAARHFRGRPIIWEIWNEPNITFWKPKPNVEQYNTLALATCRAVREADPDATIVGPATSEIPLGFLQAFFESGALGSLDAVSVHPYRNYSKPPETAVEEYAELRKVIRQYAPSGKAELPILSGEWGYATHTKGVSLETQAAFAARQQLVNLWAGVPLSIWYDWKNDGSDPAEREHNFGVVTQDLQPKPAYIAIQTLTRELAGFRIEQRLKTENERVYLLLCKAASGTQKLAAWTLQESSQVSVDTMEPLRPVRAVGSDGKIVDLPNGEHGLRILLGPAPVYVTLAPAPASGQP